MAYEIKPETGSLFKNDRKESDTHPDYKGTALLSGVEHWMDAWINTTKDGSKYMSLKFKPKEDRNSNPGVQSTYGSGNRLPEPMPLDDEVPF